MRWWLPVALLVSDRFLKVLVQNVPPLQADFSFLAFSFQETKTTTILGFFSLGSTATVITVSVVLIALFVWALTHYQLPVTSYQLLVLGGFSNLYDRFSTGAVTDVFRIAMSSNAFVFNLADAMIIFGILLLVARRPA